MTATTFDIGLNSFGEVATDNGRVLDDAETLRLLVEEAIETWWRYWEPVVAQLAEERGFYAPTRERYEAEIADGALYVGSPETVARKIAEVARALRLNRFDLKYDILHLPRQARARTIELLGREVAPRVRELLTKEPAHV